jgi:hypothetical protein
LFTYDTRDETELKIYSMRTLLRERRQQGCGNGTDSMNSRACYIYSCKNASHSNLKSLRARTADSSVLSIARRWSSDLARHSSAATRGGGPVSHQRNARSDVSERMAGAKWQAQHTRQNNSYYSTVIRSIREQGALDGDARGCSVEAVECTYTCLDGAAQ